MPFVRIGIRSLVVLALAAGLVSVVPAMGSARDSGRVPIDAQTMLSIVQHARLLVPPATTPAVVESEYTKYFGRGTGELVVPMVVALRNGGTLSFADSHLVVAYPDTAFTRWMIEKYCQKTNGIYLNADRNMYPGDPLSGITVPPYLLRNSAIDTPERSAVKDADHCDDAGNCYFEGLPPGQYIVFENEFYYKTRTAQHSYLEPYLGLLVEHEYQTAQNVAVGGVVIMGGVYGVSNHETTRPRDPLNVTALYYLPQ